MKRAFLSGLVLLLIAFAYVAYPLATAFRIREAVKAGDAAYLDSKIEWASVRNTLGPSLNTFVLGPQAAGQQAQKPGLWQRIKARIGESAVARMVESYVNAEGLPKLFTFRQTYRQHVSGEVEEPRTLSNLPGRIAKAWSRMKRAEFTSLTRLEIDMADKNTPDRIYAGVLELKGWEWKLTELRIKAAPEAARLAALPAR